MGERQRGPQVPSAVHIPEVARADLVAAAGDFHTTYDTYPFPSNIRVVEVAGWGEETAKGIKYKNQHFIQSYDTIPTIEGDGIVVYPSAVASADAEQYFFNLDLDNSGLDHGVLFNSSKIQELVQTVIGKSSINENIFISSTKPNPLGVQTKLLVSTHSPVILGITDSSGHFTGIYPGQDLSADLLYVQENIPGSTFLTSGDSQYIFLPKEGTYTFTYQGTGTGPTTVEIGEFANDVETLVARYPDIPTTPATHATSTVNSLAPQDAEIHVDSDGDGDTDEVVYSEFATKPLTVTADNKSIILGAALPTLTATLSGFIGDDTHESSVTGSPACTTTALSTSPVGTYPIACTAGTLESSKYTFDSFIDGLLTIRYAWGGFSQPIDDAGYNPALTPSIFKAGSTVPVKFKLKNANGISVQAPVAPLWLAPVPLSPLSAPVDESVYTLSPTSGNAFRYDSVAGQYIYNWSTKGFKAGFWYYISAQLDDGTLRSVIVGLR